MARKKKPATPAPRVKGTIELHGRTYRARWMVDGKYYTRSTGTADRDQAEAKLAEFIEPFKLKDEKDTLSLLAAKVQGVTAELKAYEDAKPALQLAQGFEAYRKAANRPDCGERTLADYEGYYAGLVAWMKKRRPDCVEMRHLTKADAEAFSQDFKRNHSAGTFNKRITFYSCLWRTLADNAEARLTCNPWERIAKLKGTGTFTRRELTVDELRRVCGSVTGEMRLLFAVGIYTGLRLGDAALLDWGSVDLTRRMIKVVPRKTARHAHGKPVVIPIHAALAALLAETPAEARRGYVMPETADAYQREPSILTNRIQSHFRSCGIVTAASQGKGRKAQTAVGFHSLRHTFVSLAANAGVPLAHVQSIVGHSSPAMTRHYFHESEAALQSAVAALPSIPLDGAQAAGNAPTGAADVPGATAQVDGAEGVESRFSAFCAAFDALVTEEERERAREYVRRKAEIGPA